MGTNNGEINIKISDDSGTPQSYVDRKVAQEAAARQEADNALRTELAGQVQQEADTRASEDERLEAAIVGKADDGIVIKAIILNGVTYVPASGVVDLGSVGSSSVPVIIKSQATTLLPGMLGRDNEGDGRVEIYGGANGIYGWHSVITKTYALFNVNSAPPANASNGYIMFNTTTHKTLVRYDNKWWDAMGNEVTE